MNNKSTLHVMVGLPGSGKSAYIEKHAKEGDVILSSDAIRKELFGDISHQDDKDKVFNLMHRRLKEAMDEGKDIWYDSMGITVKARRGALQFPHENYDVRAEVMVTPIDTCIERVKNPDRELILDKEVILKRVAEFRIPVKQEGFDTINFNFENPEKLKNLAEDLPFLSREMHQMNHDNPHHLESVGEHAYNVQKINEEYTKITGKRIIHPVFAYLHDIGKLYTKVYDEEQQLYRYTNHENIGAYILLSEYDLTKVGLPMDDVLRDIALVNLHMKGIDLNSAKKIEKAPSYRRLAKTYGKEMVKDISIIKKIDSLGAKAVDKITIHLDNRASAYANEQDIIDYTKLVAPDYTDEVIQMTAKEIYEGDKREYSREEFDEFLKDELQANMEFLNDKNIFIEPEEDYEL